MKNIIYLYILTGVITILFTGCEKKYLEEDKITYFADIVINGNEVVFTPLGQTYTDAGATAYENNVKIEHTTTSNVNTNNAGPYSVIYSATNSDGYSNSVARSVYVYDPNVNSTDLSGDYIANVLRNGTEGYTGNVVTLTPVAGQTGIYYISDWIAGFYAVGRGYGAAFAFAGIMQINASNEVIHLDMSNPWGDPFNSVTGTYTPGTGTIAYDARWLYNSDGSDTYSFVVDMSK